MTVMSYTRTTMPTPQVELYILPAVSLQLLNYAYGEVTVYADCFLEGGSRYGQPRLTFRNNTADLGGDTVYGGSLGFACARPDSPYDVCNTCLRIFLLEFRNR